MTCAMAIPFNLPSHEQTEDNYRRLDQLLMDLYSVLRQILVRSPCNVNVTPAEGRPHREEPVPVETAPTRSRPEQEGDATRSRQSLPDVVASTVCQCPCSRRAQPQRRHRRRRRPSCCPAEHTTYRPHPAPAPADHDRMENWLVIGEQLKKIAEEFKTAFVKKEVAEKKENTVKMEVKSTGLFSLLVPTHLQSSIWTTVILLVGWRLLVRSR